MMKIGRWNTWEELLLGGAVLRHGTQNWHIVASELQTRTPSYVFTPQVCKAKYEDLKEQYSAACSTWFEELTKKRVAELKRALELSENSIGFLESKIKSLKPETNKKESDNSCGGQNNNNNYCTEETIPKDHELSSGSFTHRNTENFSPEAENQEIMLETKPAGVAGCCHEYEKASNSAADLSACYCSANVGQFQWSNLKTRSGKRKRKDYSSSSSLTLGSVRDSESLSDTTSSDDNDDVVSGFEEFSTSNNCNNQSLNDEVEYLLSIFDSMVENKAASVFKHRLYSQKTRRYEKMIRRHMDLDAIRYRISTRTIKSRTELFVDLLVLTNNALVFYPKTTGEYQSALILRDLVTQKLSNSLDLQDFTIKSSSVATQKYNHHKVSEKISMDTASKKY
ncbi:uncharacterized protein LOC114725291 [Neltuma alba]|uniref:uncharacterized protein LOC114725291 n=1 Tax=Neltuma alba TaxID=207710 RepID=UPI0010A57BA3|nr:uncharacterized protein LOC114725291 [Prosopis alba]